MARALSLLALSLVGASSLDKTPSALALLLAALGSAKASVASDLASVVLTISKARKEAKGYRLLLDGGVVAALLHQLPNEASCANAAKAIAALAASDDGQDKLIEAEAAPQLRRLLVREVDERVGGSEALIELAGGGGGGRRAYNDRLGG